MRQAPLKTRATMLLALCALLGLPGVTGRALAQQAPRMSAESSQPLFSVMAALNACGYDAGLSQSLPLRQQIRTEVLQATGSGQAQTALRALCGFYEDHRQQDAARDLSNYVSLALNMKEGPGLELRSAESDLPPDAAFVLGFLPLLRHFSEAVNLDDIWQRHRPDYEQFIAGLHAPIRETLFSTDVYLRRNLSGYNKHAFVVFVEPLAAPAEVNSRNYGDDYFMVVSPTAEGGIHLDQLRHTYLHYVLDAKASSRGTTLDRLSPLLDSVKDAPLEESYRFDMGLLLTESLIRAIEARLLGGSKGPEKPKEELAWNSTRQGFILTEYFYRKLVLFEGGDTGLDEAYPDWLHDIDVGEQEKFAATIPFLSSGTPEVVRRSKPKEPLVELAERTLASGNLEGARSYAQQALQAQQAMQAREGQAQQDQGRALFVLARVAVAEGKLNEAQSFFGRAAAASSEARIRGWSHVYLGRILDLQERREEAVEQYRAALKEVGNESGNEGGAPELKAAAEKGLQQAYQAPARKRAE